MSLKRLCERISCNDPNMLLEDDPIGPRIMCPEYSLHTEDTKTYPLSITNQLFALCWFMKDNHRLYGTIKPFHFSFSYSCMYEAGDRTQTHTHEYLELAYIVSGDFRQCILGKDITFHKGELCLIDKNCLHQDYLDEKPACILFLGISNEMFDQIMERHVATERITSFLQSALMKQKHLLQYLHFHPNSETCTEKLELCLEQLLQELIQPDEASSTICRGLLIRIFRLLSTDYEFSLSRELQKEMNWLIYEEITKYIKANLSDISIKALTQQFHFQEDYFNRLLKSKTGKTYTEFIHDLRLSEAAQLLLETDESVEQIVNRVGYQNKGYFYKIFSDRYQMTPAQYRKNH